MNRKQQNLQVKFLLSLKPLDISKRFYPYRSACCWRIAFWSLALKYYNLELLNNRVTKNFWPVSH